MTSRRDNFVWPHQVKGRKVVARFGLRESKTKKMPKDQSIFTYAQPGRGAQGESSN